MRKLLLALATSLIASTALAQGNAAPSAATKDEPELFHSCQIRDDRRCAAFSLRSRFSWANSSSSFCSWVSSGLAGSDSVGSVRVDFCGGAGSILSKGESFAWAFAETRDAASINKDSETAKTFRMRQNLVRRIGTSN